MMLLTIDVGNTNITVGVFSSSSRSQALVSRGEISTRQPRLDQALRRLLRKLRVPSDAIGGVILSSVVPRATAALKPVLKRMVKAKLLVLGENVRAPVINRYRVPGQVGQDRLVNAAAAFYRYGGPAIVVDFGTAVTIDLVNNRREYLGGLIVPGIGIALEALAARTALLPKIKLGPPKEFLSRDTVSSMRSGIFFGYGALCDGIVRRMKADLAPKAKVISTGGHSPLIAHFCKTVQIVNPDLTLQGLELTYRLAQKIS
ncbi:MAG: type III pantothenate kinase [Candidatus Omnitrophica bacterium]|nr:type III pantothenate kinase [Candidatus Omnitrophota bacterium]